MSAVTQWFDMRISTPSKRGVYEVREANDWPSDKWFSYWNGRKFCYQTEDQKSAYLNRKKYTIAKADEWRGLSEKPE